MSGIYIHIPFCRQACHYCNFHFSTSLQQKNAVVASIIKEIQLAEPFHATETIETIYFGGGTPSLLQEDELEQLFAALHNKFNIAGNAEITFEANPDDITSAQLNDWRSKGINRLSIGIQSFVDEELVWMNRAHNAAQSSDCIDMIKDAGFSNFSADLIYGSPLLNNDDWKRNVDKMIAAQIPHISCYALTVEPKTALFKMILDEKQVPVDADRQAEQFLLLMQWLAAAGYEHYEISNFAKPGFRSEHNSSYWQGKDYYGFGPSAHAFNGSSRRWNVANNALYIQSLAQDKIPFEEELLTETQQLNEYIMISLRTMEGLDLAIVKERFGEDQRDRIATSSQQYIDAGKIKIEGEKLILTNEGKLLADGIAADLFN